MYNRFITFHESKAGCSDPVWIPLHPKCSATSIKLGQYFFNIPPGLEAYAIHIKRSEVPVHLSASTVHIANPSSTMYKTALPFMTSAYTSSHRQVLLSGQRCFISSKPGRMSSHTSLILQGSSLIGPSWGFKFRGTFLSRYHPCL